MFIIKNGKFYDWTKWVALIGLPAFGTFYVALGAIWSFENTQAVSGTVLAVDAFLGALLGLSSASYKASDEAHDGTVGLVDHGDGPAYAINIKGDDPDAVLASKDTITLKVNPPSMSMPTQPGATTNELQNPGGTNTNGY